MAARETGADRHPIAPASLHHLVGRVEHRMSREVGRALAGGPSLEQWRVLDLLADGEGRAMSEIAAYVLVPAPTLTKIVDRLVESAMVYRRPDDADRRRVLVFLSDHGREVHASLAPDVARAENDAVATLGVDERAGLIAMLERLTR